MRACGFAPGDIVLNCFGYHLTPAAAMFEEGAHGIGCTVVPAGIGNSELQVAVAAHYRANGYIGLPSYLKVLLEQAKKSGASLAIAKALVLAEKLPESLRAEFQREHGIHVRQGYGTAELGAIAYECEAARGFHLDPGVLAEIVDPATGAPVEPGTPGEVVCTPLNPVYALLRFATGDLAALDTTPCPCGRTTHRLTAILGRVDQSTKVRGLFLHPAQLTEALASFPPWSASAPRWCASGRWTTWSSRLSRATGSPPTLSRRSPPGSRRPRNSARTSCSWTPGRSPTAPRPSTTAGAGNSRHALWICDESSIQAQSCPPRRCI